MEAHLDNTTICAAIRKYATNLSNVLGERIGVLSDSNRIDRCVYQPALLQPHDFTKATNWTSRSQDRHALLTETQLLQKWLDEGDERKPLLIVAPAGMGKSCLLESWALAMAKQILAQPLDSVTVPAVPMLVSLARVARSSLSLTGYLLQAERGITEKTPALNPELIEYLREHKKLLLLIDGFDEAPDVHSLNDCFVLTSRPEYGERSVVHEEERHYALQGISENDAPRYITAYFDLCAYKGISATEAVKKYKTASQGILGRSLDRPLYLYAWCEYLRDHDPHEAPRSIDDLAKQSLRTTLSQRKPFESLSDADLDLLVDKLLTWLGRLGYYFADNSFNAQRRHSLAAKNLIPGDALDLSGVALRKLGDIRTPEDVAFKCNLFFYKKTTREFLLPKIPLVEYAIGKYLADDAIAHPDAPVLLIDTFRRWIWRLELHDTLDYTFAALWEGESPLRHLTAQLLAWAVEVGRHDLTRITPSLPLANDDLLHPFALAALRWHSFNAGLSVLFASRAREAAEQIGEAARFALIQGSYTLLRGPPLPVLLLKPLLEGMRDSKLPHNTSNDVWSQALQDVASRVLETEASDFVETLIDLKDQLRGGHSKDVWRFVISRAARRVPESEAAGLTEKWIQWHFHSVDVDANETWRRAIEEVSGRIPEAEATSLVLKWIKRCDDSGDDDTIKAWGWAIQMAAGRVPGTEAADLVKHLIHRHCHSKNKRAVEEWESAIASIANQVQEEDAADLVRQLLVLYDLPGDRLSKFVWGLPIVYASSRLCETEAEGFVEKWIDRYRRLENIHFNHVWMWAIQHTARRVPEAKAAEIIRKWVGLLEGSSDEIAKATRRWAIMSVAERVRDTEALELIKELVEREIRPNDECIQVASWLAIENLVRRVPVTDMHDIIERLFGLFNLSGNEETKGTLARAIAHSARRIPEAEAADLIWKWIELLDHSVDQDTKETRCWAIAYIADSVRQSEAMRLIRKSIYLYNQPGDENIKEAWRRAILSAAGRVQEADAVENLCNGLITAGMHLIAIQVAEHRTDIAVLSELMPGEDRKPSVRFRAIRRDSKKLILDKNLVAAPPTIKTILAAARSSAASQRVSGQPLTPASASSADAGHFVFRRGRANTWEFAFNSGMRSFGANLKGFEYLARLIKRHDQRISPLEFVHTGDATKYRLPSDRDRPDEVLDLQAAKAYVERAKELRTQLGVTKDSKLEEELGQITKALRQASRPGRKSVTLRKSEIEKATKNVQNAIVRALEALRSNGFSELAAHLADCAKVEEYHFVYRNPKPPAWDVNWLPPIDSKPDRK